MKKTFCRLQILMLLLVSLIISVGTASAITITQTQAYSGIPNFTKSLTFNKWYNYGSNLQSIEIIMTLNVTGGTLSVDNEGATGGTVVFTLGSIGKLTGPNSLNWAEAVTGTSTKNLSVGADDGDGPLYQPGGVDHATYVGENIGPIVNNRFLSGDSFASYTGTGTINLSAVLTQYTDTSGVSGLTFSSSPVNTSGTVTIKYTDNEPPPPVPEPATLLLLGSGIVGIIGAGRRGRKKV